MRLIADFNDRVNLCGNCYHQQNEGRRCDWCGEPTMRINHQAALALKITAAHEERMRHGEPLPDVQIHRAQ